VISLDVLIVGDAGHQWKPLTQNLLHPHDGGDVVIPAGMIEEYGLHWMVKVQCGGHAMTDPGIIATDPLSGCETHFSLPGSCSSCNDGTCSLDLISGSFTCNIPLGSGFIVVNRVLLGLFFV
jgi:hypothetical protein